MPKHRQVRKKLSHSNIFSCFDSLYLTCRRDITPILIFGNNGWILLASCSKMLKLHSTCNNEKSFFDLSAFFNFISFQNFGIHVSFKILSAGNLALTILSGKSVFVRVHIFLSSLRVPFLCYTFLVKYSEPLATWCVIASNNYPWGVQATMNKCSSHINSPTSPTRHKLTMDAS